MLAVFFVVIEGREEREWAERLGAGISGDASGGRGLLCLPGRAEGLRWRSLSGIGKPGSGTEPIHQEHMRCSRFRGSCLSDVKSAGHPEPGFPIPLNGYSAALCAPKEPPKSPSAGSLPGYRPRSHPPSSGILPPPRKRRSRPCQIPFYRGGSVSGAGLSELEYYLQTRIGTGLRGELMGGYVMWYGIRAIWIN